MKVGIYMILMAAFLISPVWADTADVVDARVTYTGGDSFSFSVTVRHADKGWKHYADRWEVLAPDGTVLATRVLLHPHVDEQPFTRSLSGVKIPPQLQFVTIRAHDSVHGYGVRSVRVTLPQRKP
jgi:hypothetical protein